MIGRFRQDSKSSFASRSFSKKSSWNKASIVWLSAASLNGNGRLCEQNRQHVPAPKLVDHCVHCSFVHIGNRVAGVAASKADKRPNVVAAFCGQGEKSALRKKIKVLNGHQKSPCRREGFCNNSGDGCFNQKETTR